MDYVRMICFQILVHTDLDILELYTDPSEKPSIMKPIITSNCREIMHSAAQVMPYCMMSQLLPYF